MLDVIVQQQVWYCNFAIIDCRAGELDNKT